MTTEDVDCAVIGAGIVGLAAAAALARAGREVVVLEAAETPGTGITARNSEVVHGGLYYPPGSLKAALCVEGRRRLWTWCAERGVPHHKTGKLVVATHPEQEGELRALHDRAAANGVEGLCWLDGAEARAREPALHATAALESPETGIVDAHQLVLSVQAEAEDHGAVVVPASPVTGGTVTEAGPILHVGGETPVTLRCRCVVNAAGLDAPRVAAALDGLDPARVPVPRFAKGNYFGLTGRCPFTRLIYPVPEPGGLGIHLTLDLQGRARFGPDVAWVAAPGYGVDADRAGAFEAAVRAYWPDLPAGALEPAYAGVRPKIAGPGDPAADFRLDGPADHGVPGLVNLFGIESPGLTACLALADRVATIFEALPSKT